MTSFREFLEEELRDNEFAQEYEKVSEEMDFALALAFRREELDMTQRDLAEETGIRQPMIARIEHGQMPTAPTLQRLAKALRIHILFTGDEIKVIPYDDRRGPYVKRQGIQYEHRQEKRERTNPFKVDDNEAVTFNH